MPASFSAVPDPDPELLDLLDEMRARDECASSKIYQAIVFSTAIRLVMRQCHMSASDLARKLSVDRSALYHWFNKKAFPSNLPELWQRLGQLYWSMT